MPCGIFPAHARRLGRERSDLKGKAPPLAAAQGGKRLACQCLPQRDLTVVTMP